MGENVLQLLGLCPSPGDYAVFSGCPAILVGAWRQRPFPWKIFFLTLCLMRGMRLDLGDTHGCLPKDLEKPVTQEQREKLRTSGAGFIPSGSPFWPTYCGSGEWRRWA